MLYRRHLLSNRLESSGIVFLKFKPIFNQVSLIEINFQERPGKEGNSVTGSQTIELITSNCIDTASGSSLVTAPQESEGNKVTDKKTTR